MTHLEAPKRPPDEQVYGVNQQTEAEARSGNRRLAEQEQERFTAGVRNFRSFFLEAIAQSDLSDNESESFSYEVTDGHWEAVGNIPNPDGSIRATFSVGLKSRSEEGVHEPYAIISYPHDKDRAGNVRTMHDHPDAIKQIIVSVGDYLEVDPEKTEKVLRESGLLYFST